MCPCVDRCNFSSGVINSEINLARPSSNVANVLICVCGVNNSTAKKCRWPHAIACHIRAKFIDRYIIDIFNVTMTTTTTTMNVMMPLGVPCACLLCVAIPFQSRGRWLGVRDDGRRWRHIDYTISLVHLFQRKNIPWLKHAECGAVHLAQWLKGEAAKLARQTTPKKKRKKNDKSMSITAAASDCVLCVVERKKRHRRRTPYPICCPCCVLHDSKRIVQPARQHNGMKEEKHKLIIMMDRVGCIAFRLKHGHTHV